MSKEKKVTREIIITIILTAVCIIAFFVLKPMLRGDLSASSGGEVFIILIPLIVYLFIHNWKSFIELCFPKDTTFEDYFDEYFTGKDMVEEESSNIIDINDFITR